MSKTGALIVVLSAIITLSLLRPSVARGEQVTVQGAPALPSVKQAVICEKINTRIPWGLRDAFPSNIGTLYCFTQLAEIPLQGVISHIWYYGKREMARVELTVSPPQWRTWSSKTILPNWKGNWKVDIVWGDHILKTLTFIIE
jgi:hypothetical protein